MKEELNLKERVKPVFPLTFSLPVIEVNHNLSYNIF